MQGRRRYRAWQDDDASTIMRAARSCVLFVFSWPSGGNNHLLIPCLHCAGRCQSAILRARQFLRLKRGSTTIKRQTDHLKADDVHSGAGLTIPPLIVPSTRSPNSFSQIGRHRRLPPGSSPYCLSNLEPTEIGISGPTCTLSTTNISGNFGDTRNR